MFSRYAASEMAKIELARLLQRIDNCCETMKGFQNNNVKLMLYFDEAHVLAERNVPHDRDGKDLYDVLCSCLNNFVPSPIFTIFVSTTSNITQPAPQPPLARSARARAEPGAPQAPVTETPFDCSPRFPIKPRTIKLKDVSEVEFMAQFGRPM